jgi:SAM-dependent methyltransferase
MLSASLRAHAAVPFMNPMNERDVDGAIAALALPSGARVVETGCGAGEVLLRVLEAHPGATGVGVDPDGDALERARVAAARRVPGREPALVEASAAEAGLVAGGFDLVVNVAASHAHGGFPQALGELAELARPGGGLVLFGEGYWTCEPSPEFLMSLGGATADELPLGLDALLAAARVAGLDPLAAATCTEADLTAYEEGLAAEAERYDDADAIAYARRTRERRALPGGASTLGFALLTLRR